MLRGVTTQFGIGSHSGHHVSRHIHLGDNLNAALLGIGHNLAQVVEGVETAAAVLGVVVVFGAVGGVVEAQRTAANGTDLGQARIFGNLNAPALVVGEMPVEAVEFVDGCHVNEFLHLFFCEEMARHVEHETAVAKGGAVLDGQTGNGPFGPALAHRSIDGHGQELAQRLECVEETRAAVGLDVNRVGRHL